MGMFISRITFFEIPKSASLVGVPGPGEMIAASKFCAKTALKSWSFGSTTGKVPNVSAAS